jgi:hypothetical protein
MLTILQNFHFSQSTLAKVKRQQKKALFFETGLDFLNYSYSIMIKR